MIPRPTLKELQSEIDSISKEFLFECEFIRKNSHDIPQTTLKYHLNRLEALTKEKKRLKTAIARRIKNGEAMPPKEACA